MRLETRVRISIIPALLSLLCSCSDDPGSPADSTPPAAVNSLVAVTPDWDRITLVWTAPGDDGWTGTAAQYDIRYSLSPLTEAVWPSAAQAAGEPAPKPGGSADTFVVTGLSPTTNYYFALKTADDEGNWSAKSNIASAPTITKPDDVPPAAVTDLAVIAYATNTVTLTWTAPGDDGTTGTAAYYDVRYSRDPITEAVWAAASQAGGEPQPKPAGAAETFTVGPLAPGTRYYFALKTADEKPNLSGLSNVVGADTQTPP
jgi:chitodextrinase